MSIVSCEVAHALDQRAGRLGIHPATRFFGQRLKVDGELMEHGEVVPHSEGFLMKETSWPDLSLFGRRRERPWKNMLLLKRSEEQLQHIPGQRRHSSLVLFLSCTGTTQANERKRQCEDGIWDPRL